MKTLYERVVAGYDSRYSEENMVKDTQEAIRKFPIYYNNALKILRVVEKTIEWKGDIWDRWGTNHMYKTKVMYYMSQFEYWHAINNWNLNYYLVKKRKVKISKKGMEILEQGLREFEKHRGLLIQALDRIKPKLEANPKYAEQVKTIEIFKKSHPDDSLKSKW